MKIFIKKKLFPTIFFLLLCFIIPDFIIPGFSYAGMIQVSDSQLSEITGTGIIAFSLTDDITRMDLNIASGMYSDIDSIKLGYYHDGVSSGWDQDWTNVTVGSDSQELVVNGVYFEAVYSNINDPSARGLSSIRIGTDNATGIIAGNFNSYSGSITTGGGAVIIDGHRQTASFSQINLDQSGVSIKFDSSGGYSVDFTNATVN